MAPSKPHGTVVVVSGKGGVGKTKTVQGVGGGLKVIGARPDALLDDDYGASLTRAYGYQPAIPVAREFLDGNLSFEDALNETDEDISLIPTDASLSSVGKEKTLAWRDRLRELGREKLIVVDTSDDILSAPVAAAILAADILLVPTLLNETTYKRTFPEISGLLAAQKHAPEIMWFATMTSRPTQYSRWMEQQIAEDGIELLARIPTGVAANEAETKGVSVVASHPSSSVAKAYIELARLVYARLQRLNGAAAGREQSSNGRIARVPSAANV